MMENSQISNSFANAMGTDSGTIFSTCNAVLLVPDDEVVAKDFTVLAARVNTYQNGSRSDYECDVLT